MFEILGATATGSAWNLILRLCLPVGYLSWLHWGNFCKIGSVIVIQVIDFKVFHGHLKFWPFQVIGFGAKDGAGQRLRDGVIFRGGILLARFFCCRLCGFFALGGIHKSWHQASPALKEIHNLKGRRGEVFVLGPYVKVDLFDSVRRDQVIQVIFNNMSHQLFGRA